MTTCTPGQEQAEHQVAKAFVRFVVCGGGVGLASSGALVLLHDRMPLAVANAVITVVSTLVATELHARVTFRGTRAGWGVHVRSGLTVAVAYAVTTAALLVLYRIQSAPAAAVEQAVYLSASAVAGAGRFVVLRTVVFRKRATKGEPALGTASVVMAA